MKRLFFGLAVAVVALSASAFTAHQTRLDTVYITGNPGGTHYSYDQTPRDCDGPSQPCTVQSKAGYSFPTLPTGSIPVSDINATNVTVLSEQSSF